MIEIIDCKGDVVTIELLRVLKADNIDAEFEASMKRTEGCTNIQAVVNSQYNLLKSIHALKRPYERRLINGERGISSC